MRKSITPVKFQNLKQIKQRGITLVVAILFLLVLTIISVFAATNSSLELKMAGNMQDSFTSFQTAEAAAKAVLALSTDPATDPFDGVSTDQPVHPKDTDTEPGWDPFVDWADDAADHPLANVSGNVSDIDVTLNLTTSASSCPRSANGFSSDILACDHYDIGAIHDEEQKARTEVHLGAVKTVIGKGVL
jgi:hypothetical protein